MDDPKLKPKLKSKRPVPTPPPSTSLPMRDDSYVSPKDAEEMRQYLKDKQMDEAQQKAFDAHTKRPLNERKAGGMIKKMRTGGFVRSADGIAKKGKTRGKVC